MTLRRPPQISLQLRSHAPPHQRALGLPPGSVVQIHQEPGLPPFENSNRQPVPVEQTVTRQCRKTVSRRRDAHQVQGIGGAHRDQRPLARLLAQGAELAHGFGQGVLLAGEAVHEAATSDLSSRFQTAEDLEKVSPGGEQGLALQELAEDHAVAAEQGPGGGLDGVSGGGLHPGLSGGVEQRPAAGVLHAEEGEAGAAASGAVDRRALVGGGEEGSQAGEAVRGHETPGDELGEGHLQLGVEETGAVRDLAEEAGAPALQEIVDGPCSRRELQGGWIGGRRDLPPEGEAVAGEEGEGRGPHRAGAPGAVRGGRAATAPDPAAGEAEGVEPGGIVLLHPRRQDLPFPGGGRDLEPLELAEQRVQAPRSLGPLVGIDPLPGEEEAQEIGL